jgi:membrane protein implicated in regulation of membrane protease activity
MNNAKTIITIIAVILGTIVALAAIGTIITAVQYLFWLGVLCVVALAAVKLFKKSDSPQLESNRHVKELKNTDRVLEEYKRKKLAK